MKTPTTIEALEGAIEMLRALRTGEHCSDHVFSCRLGEFEAARDAHHIAQMQKQRRREQIRELSDQARAKRQGASS